MKLFCQVSGMKKALKTSSSLSESGGIDKTINSKNTRNRLSYDATNIPPKLSFRSFDEMIVNPFAAASSSSSHSLSPSLSLSQSSSANTMISVQALVEEILRLDQLKIEQKKQKVFLGFQEALINFPPTYKYDKRSSSYDTCKKARCPAWTDRILYNLYQSKTPVVTVSTSTSSTAEDTTKDDSKSTRDIETIDYCSYDVRSSDHRPVCCSFLYYY
jgi:hypothetical protein